MSEVRRAQRLMEGAASRGRKELRRYSKLTELQRQEFLAYRRELETFQPPDPAEEALRLHQLHLADDFWADHLAETETIMEGLVLQIIAGRDPWLEFTRMSDRVFSEGWEAMEERGRLARMDWENHGRLPSAADQTGVAGGGTWAYQASLEDAWEYRLPSPPGGIAGAAAAMIRRLLALN